MNRIKKILTFLILGSFLLSCNFAQEFLGGTEEIAGTTEISPSEASHDLVPSPSSQPTSAPTLPPPVSTERHIIYVNGGNLWLIKGENPPVQITNSGGATWTVISSDGMKMAFTRSAPDYSWTELRSVNSDGSDETVLLSADDINELYPSGVETAGFEISQIGFLPGTQDLFFNTMELFQEIGGRQHDDLLRIDTDSGELIRVLPPGQGGQFLFSPDGQKIALIRPDSIDLISADGDPIRKNAVTYTPVITYSEFLYYAQPVWSPDSSFLGVAIPSEDPLVDSTSGTIWAIPADGSEASVLGVIPGDFYFPQVFSSSTLSPQIDRVAFIRQNAVDGSDDLYIANLFSMEEMIYTSGEVHWGSWAPDGKHFVYGFTDPMSLYLGAEDMYPTLLVTGTNFRWINAREYVCLSEDSGTWTLMRGVIGGMTIPLARLESGYNSYDFNQ